MKILIAPNGTKILGTLDRIPGVALIVGATRRRDGEFGLEYSGETDVDRDNQTTLRDKSGARKFVDDDGQIWSESELRLVKEVE